MAEEENKNKQANTKTQDDEDDFESLLDDCAKNLDTQLKITSTAVT